MAAASFVPSLKPAAVHAAAHAREGSLGLQAEQPPCIQRAALVQTPGSCAGLLRDGLGLVPASAALCAGVAARSARRRRRGHKLVTNAIKASLISKLRERAARPAPPLKEAPGGLESMSSALPPGSEPPELCARAHKLIEEKPELLDGVDSHTDLEFLPMTEDDAADLSDLQLEFFPTASYPGGVQRCVELLTHPDVVSIKACLPGDETKAPVGFFQAAGSRAGIEFCTPDSTVQKLRQEVTIKQMVPFDTKDRRELAYILSVGVIYDLRKRGLARELLRRGVDQLKQLAADAPGGTGLRYVALDLVDYNKAAMKCYESFGFKRIHEQAEAYAGIGRRTHSSFLYTLDCQEEQN
eukprot:TRINITY_DN111891_c0_g1_i1.p1 TRINITY_DN111891_c0_g1~~TRINITY_DN111891_c0_g1_i1.p1  ORF type:complete len:354 (-),score=91.15 TRINITY_DN111891_c0_g1_i1:19-1080(-)